MGALAVTVCTLSRLMQPVCKSLEPLCESDEERPSSVILLRQLGAVTQGPVPVMPSSSCQSSPTSPLLMVTYCELIETPVDI
jgi:hypothetical protein